MIARAVLQLFLPKRYKQLEVDLCRLALFVKPDWTMEKVLWMDSRSKLEVIEAWAVSQATEGLKDTSKVNVEVGPSLAENAGEGVFCLNGAKAGTLICVHPGTMHSADSVRKASERGSGRLYERIFVHDLPHCVQLFDGTLIDAGRDSEGEWQAHPFAVGHKCNHPPKGVKPNVMKCPFWWNPEPAVNVNFKTVAEENVAKENDDDTSSSFTERFGLVERIRNEMGFSSSKVNQIRGLGFVTTRDVVPGEELFVNYRYNPKIPAPEWYHPVDVTEDEARWS